MSITDDTMATLYPEHKNFYVIQKFSGDERILPEVRCIELFGEERWRRICSGQDRSFDAVPYQN